MTDLQQLAKTLGELCTKRGILVATAESCTGGLIAGAMTDVEGASAWFDRGFVTYSNEAKQELLGVRKASLEACGAVSEVVAREMALGALAHARADVAASVTGIAGPGGGTPEKPVGTVCFGWAAKTPQGPACRTTVRHFAGDRQAVRRASVAFVLQELAALVKTL